MDPPEASLLRLSLSALLLLPLIACPEGDSLALPPFPALPAVSAPSRTAMASPFQVEPYLQLGPGPASPERLALVWHAQDGPGDWAVEIEPQAGGAWTRMDRPVSALVDLPGRGSGPLRVWTATLAPLEPGLPFDYRVLLDGTEVFRAEGKALKAPGQAQRVVVAGGLAYIDGPEADALARQIHQQNPDLMVAAGGLVPPDGLEPRQRSFFSVYNAGRDERSGAPFMRGTVLVSAPARDAGPAGRLAYRAFWDQPQAGREGWAGQVRGCSLGGGPCPGPGNFSFRSGDVHWTVLDSSRSARWSEPGPRAWLARELAGAQSARWRFAVIAPHAPDPDPLRTLWPLFRKYRVAIVFTGHQPCLTGAARQPGPAPAQRGASFARLEITGTRVLCEQVDGRGIAFDRFILSQ